MFIGHEHLTMPLLAGVGVLGGKVFEVGAVSEFALDVADHVEGLIVSVFRVAVFAGDGAGRAVADEDGFAMNHLGGWNVGFDELRSFYLLTEIAAQGSHGGVVGFERFVHGGGGDHGAEVVDTAIDFSVGDGDAAALAFAFDDVLLDQDVDDVGTVIRTPAVPDGSNLRDICGDLYTAAVVHAQAGLPPDSLRQVCH